MLLAKHLALPALALLLSPVALAQGVLWVDRSQQTDQDRDGLDDATGTAVAATQAPDPLGTGPIHTISLGALGIPGPVNSATWEFDEAARAANGAKGYLWVGVTSLSENSIYKIDTLTPAIVASYQLSVVPDGLAWDGAYIIVQSTFDIHQVDPLTGTLVSTIPKPAGANGYGICWKPSHAPSPDQYLWAPNFSGPINQIHHFTGAVVFSFPGNGSAIGSLTDGKTLWTSDFLASVFRQWDMVTGAPLETFSVGAVNTNPRDGTWDGHHLWDVTWENGGFAWQWDLYAATGLYPVTVSLRPKAITAAPGGTLVVGIGVKNHSAGTLTARILLDVFDSANAPVNDVLIKRTVHPGEVIDFHWSAPVPASWSSGDTFKVRARPLAPTEESRAEDWAIIRVL